MKLFVCLCLFFSIFFVANPVSSAELKLKKTYLHLGFGRKLSNSLLAQLLNLFKAVVTIPMIQCNKVNSDVISVILCNGLLLDLTEVGEQRVAASSLELLKPYQNEYSLKKSKKIFCELRSALFMWLADRLSRCEPFSFAQSYLYKHENMSLFKIDIKNDPLVRDFVLDIDFKSSVIVMG